MYDRRLIEEDIGQARCLASLGCDPDSKMCKDYHSGKKRKKSGPNISEWALAVVFAFGLLPVSEGLCD
jgi:hypothetical protein